MLYAPNSAQYPGFLPSAVYGMSDKLIDTRGMFSGGSYQGAGIDAVCIRVADVADGTSNTILLGEVLPEYNEYQRYSVPIPTTPKMAGWAFSHFLAHGQTIQYINWPIDEAPVDAPWGCGSGFPETNPSGDINHCVCNWGVSWGFSSHHPSGVNFAMADGSVHWFSQTMDHQLLQWLGCRNDGHAAGAP